MAEKIKKLTAKRAIFIFLAVLSIILIFTLIDFLVHSLSEEFSVPGYYFRNKIIFGAIIGFIACLFLRKASLIKKAVLFSLITSALLQIRYAYEGYSLSFVLEFFAIHFLILLVLSFITFKYLFKEQ